MNKISIALPVFNGANFIREAIESILIQDYSDFEFVIVDNASTDETISIINEYVQDDRIKLFCFKEYLGQVENVNRAAKLCTNNWIHFFCHDDIMLQGCINHCMQVINTSNYEDFALLSHKPAWLFMNNIVNVPFNAINGNKVFEYQDFISKSKIDTVEVIEHKKDITAINILNGNGVYLPALTTAVVKKDVFIELGLFDEKYIHFDIFFWMRLLKTHSYIELDKALTLTRIHGNQVAVDARKSLRTIEDHKIFWKEYLNFIVAKPTLKQKTTVFLKPITTAVGIITVAIIKNGFFKGIKLLFSLPISWISFSLVFLPLRYISEIKLINKLKKYLTVDMIYP
ncbi:glycosyltransferase family 2 protein [Flavobacterium sp. LB1P62]|uniref:glycosyltransferase family 2 protein n=1 Tax=Flavobacterium sp. LB1P62 TaxID=3401715 RepID=UPI003AACEECA